MDSGLRSYLNTMEDAGYNTLFIGNKPSSGERMTESWHAVLDVQTVTNNDSLKSDDLNTECPLNDTDIRSESAHRLGNDQFNNALMINQQLTENAIMAITTLTRHALKCNQTISDHTIACNKLLAEHEFKLNQNVSEHARNCKINIQNGAKSSDWDTNVINMKNSDIIKRENDTTSLKTHPLWEPGFMTPKELFIDYSSTDRTDTISRASDLSAGEFEHATKSNLISNVNISNKLTAEYIARCLELKLKVQHFEHTSSWRSATVFWDIESIDIPRSMQFLIIDGAEDETVQCIKDFTRFKQLNLKNIIAVGVSSLEPTFKVDEQFSFCGYEGHVQNGKNKLIKLMNIESLRNKSCHAFIVITGTKAYFNAGSTFLRKSLEKLIEKKYRVILVNDGSRSSKG